MTRSSLRLSLMSLVLTLGACDCSSPPDEGCITDDDCAVGESCIDSMCVTEQPMTDGGGIDGMIPAMCTDSDRDGHQGMNVNCETGTDCNDGDRTINPDVAEVCGDGVDNDCDGEIDEPDCECTRGDRIACYEGDATTAGVGMCRRGITICIEPGMTGDCRGQVLPGEETCDGTDEDCDGSIDETLRNACGECGAEPEELCGDGIDNDCNGMVDEDCNCDYRCQCPEASSCVCEPPTNQPCYEGPFRTGGRGVCTGGRRDCVADAVSGEERWAMCDGQVLPSEECAGGTTNSLDDDCDGVIDEGCRDADGDGSPFPTDCDDTDPAINPAAAETCNGRDDNCNGVADEGVVNACGACGMPAARETCGNGLDDDCNGRVDDTCGCNAGETGMCYGGPDGTQGVGACMAGTFSCVGGGEFPEWGACMGQVTPLPEICSGIDDDCDGSIDERWATGSNACGFCNPTEICDGMDQDCDGLIDEGVSNACGECGEEPVEACDGADNDCDGAIDENVVNACGTCPPEPCFNEEWSDLSDCEQPGRVCDDVEEDPMYPGSVTLGSSTLDFDYIYIAVTGRNQVAQIDTTTGVKNWQVASHGTNPSRTAVTSDGSVWVSNRGFGNPASAAQSNVVHLAEDGSLICRAPVLNIARSVAIDRNGDIWAGSYNNGDLYHISGTMVNNATTPPSCVVLNQMNIPAAGARNIYGLAADADGFVWTASNPTVRVNIADYSTTTFANSSHYGVAADGTGRVWYGGLNGGGLVHALNRTTGAVTTTTGNITGISGVTVHPEGSIWGSRYSGNQLAGFESNGTLRCTVPITSGRNPHGVAVDRLGRIWVPSRFDSGTVSVFNTDCSFVATYTVDAGQELYSYSDMTGHLLRTFVSPEGNWSQVFDSGYALAYWTASTWVSIEPAGTDILMTMRTADTEAGLDAGVACGPFNTSPADLSMCPAGFQNHRFLRVEATLTRMGTDARPILRSVDASWAY